MPVELTWRTPEELPGNPANPRRHPDGSLAPIEASLKRWGWLKPVLFNRRTGRLINGHARVALAGQRAPAAPLPTVEVDLPYAEERELLLTYDRLGAMRQVSPEPMLALLEELADSLGTLPSGYEDDYLAALQEAVASLPGGTSPFLPGPAAPVTVLTGEYRALNCRFTAEAHAATLTLAAGLAALWGTEGLYATVTAAMDLLE